MLRPGEVTVDDIQRGHDSFNNGDNQNQARLLLGVAKEDTDKEAETLLG